MSGGHRDDAGVPSLGPQDMGRREDPGLRQQGPRAEPVILRDPGQIIHAEQNMPREQAGLSTPTANNPLRLTGERSGRPAAGWTETWRGDRVLRSPVNGASHSECYESLH